MGQCVLTDEMATLSKLLQKTMLDTDAFIQAVEEGYIELADDGKHLKWMLGSKTLLAYFCGRMWCGDRGKYSRRLGTKLWIGGQKTFPGQELSVVFGITLLKQVRQIRKNMCLPQHYELIDILFDS